MEETKPVNAITTRTAMFPSRQEAWKSAREFVERFTKSAGLEREKGLKTNLVVEELFTNTVRHGHRGGSDAPVWITLEGGNGHVRLIYEDNAPPFNPFARSSREVARKLAEEGREGGLGVVLAHALAASADYAYLFGRNRISLEVA
jgi:anti-sigma regulatory factor (Ser/Thr protein kinase)